MWAFILIGTLMLGVLAYAAQWHWRLGKLPGMSFEQMLRRATKDEDSIITAGTLRDGKMSYAVYGQDGKLLPKAEHLYEIGSITKTFTAALLARAVLEGHAALPDDAGKALPGLISCAPSWKALATHTSGLRTYYFDWQTVSNKLAGRNDFYGISSQRIISQLAKHPAGGRVHPFRYSNFGIAVLGQALAGLYHQPFSALMDGFLKTDLGLHHTRLGLGEGDLSNYWTWAADDGYLPAGGLVSTIGDMLRYVQLHLDGALPYLRLATQPLLTARVSGGPYARLGLRMDEAAICWMIDRPKGLIWHNGGTGHFNAYLAMDYRRGLGVVVLSNLSYRRGIPATFLGLRLMEEMQAGYHNPKHSTTKSGRPAGGERT